MKKKPKGIEVGLPLTVMYATVFAARICLLNLMNLLLAHATRLDILICACSAATFSKKFRSCDN